MEAKLTVSVVSVQTSESVDCFRKVQKKMTEILDVVRDKRGSAETPT